MRLVALSLALSHGEKGRAAVGVEVCCKENRLCRLLFIFQTTCINGCKSKLLFKLLKSQNPQQPAPSPVGEGWGEGILQIAATFPNISTVQIQALRLVALSLALSHGREDGAAVGVKDSARKTGCAGCFLLFRRPASTVVNPSCFSNCLQPQNLLQPSPSPVGEGWGEGILPNSGNLSQIPNCPKYKPCGLLPSL